MEILYKMTSLDELTEFPADSDITIRWLKMPEDSEVFIEHLRERYPDREFHPDDWLSWEENGTPYCGLFKNGKMIARSAAEKYLPDTWETSDVRVWYSERNHGYAKQICCFVTKFIIESKKTATIRTEEDNFSMRKVIHSLGFSEVGFID